MDKRKVALTIVSLIALAILAGFVIQRGDILGAIGGVAVIAIAGIWIVLSVWYWLCETLSSKLACIAFLLLGSLVILAVSIACGVNVDSALPESAQVIQRSAFGVSVAYVLAFVLTVLMYYLIAVKADLDVARFSFLVVSCISTVFLFLITLTCQLTPQETFVNLAAAGSHTCAEAISAEFDQYDIRGLLTCLVQAMYAPVWLALIVGEEKVRSLEESNRPKENCGHVKASWHSPGSPESKPGQD